MSMFLSAGARRASSKPRIHRKHPLLRTFGDHDVFVNFTDESYELDFLEERMLFIRTFLVNKPEMIKHILVDNAQNYPRTKATQNIFKPILGTGLFANQEPEWRLHRRIVAPSLHPRSLAGYVETMRDVLRSTLARWSALESGAVIDISDEMVRMSLQVIIRTMASVDSSAILEPMARGIKQYLSEARLGLADILGLPPWVPRRKTNQRAAERAFRECDAAIAALVDERMSRPGPRANDLLDQLLNARDGEERLSRREIRDEMVNIFLAGHETTAATLAWAFYLLSLNPAAERKLHRELDQELGGRLPEDSDLDRLPYLRMVIQETLRLYPPAYSLAREAVARDEVDGHVIPKGSRLLIIPWVLHRHRRHWAHPDRFFPEHFLPDRVAVRSRLAYLPFGVGPRMCIGANFAMKEAMLALAGLAQKYRLRLVPRQDVRPQALMILRPTHGIKMTLYRRLSLVESEDAVSALARSSAPGALG